MVDERAFRRLHDPHDPGHCPQKDLGCIRAAHISADHHECPYSGRLERLYFERAISDALVFREHNPAAIRDPDQPDGVFCRLVPMLIVALTLVAGSPKHIRNVDLAEGTVDKKDDRFRRLRSGALLQSPPA